MTSLSSPEDLLVRIEGKTYAKIMHWIEKATGEVSGLGKVIVDGNEMLVTDAILLDQENTAASTELEADAITKAMYEMREVEGHLNFWWHSHANMDVFWSGTDKDTILQLGEKGWVLASVFNKKREVKTAYYQKSNGFYPSVFVDDICTREIWSISDNELSSWDEEFKQKCKTKTSTYQKLRTGGTYIDEPTFQEKKKLYEEYYGVKPANFSQVVDFYKDYISFGWDGYHDSI